MCFSKVAENVQKRALCLTSRSSGLWMFHKVLWVITQNQAQTDMDCTKPAQKIQTPLHVHLEVTLICTFLAYDILRITGNFPYNLFFSNLLLYICKYSTKAIIHFEGMLQTQNWNFFNNVINTKRELTLRDNVVNYGIRKAGYLMSVKKQWWFDFKTSKCIFSWHSFSNTPSRLFD